MKSQDIFLLLKVISLEETPGGYSYDYTARGLATLTGVGKTEVNAAINRSIVVGLAKNKNSRGLISVNRKGLYEFIHYGLKYVFPAKPAELTRGVPTAFAAPVLRKKLLSAGDLIPVWPDAEASKMGLSVSPLYHSVPFAIATDERLYAYLALIDAIRIGNAREFNVASKELRKQLSL